jgi:subtilisin family serine protease
MGGSAVHDVELEALMAPLEMVNLGALMELSGGSAEVSVALIDGPVAADHPDLTEATIRPIDDKGSACLRSDSDACAHGTFVAGVLVGRRGSPAPAICPDCTLLVRPVFGEAAAGEMPTASADEVAQAIVESVDAGARVINLSAAIGRPTTRVESGLREALNHAAKRGTIVVAATGNQAALGSSEITRHHGVIPVVSYDRDGRPMERSNFASSAGRRGLGAPGDAVISLGADHRPSTRSGTSFAAAFVSATIALLWSLFTTAHASEIRHALAQGRRRTTVIPPLLDAEAAYHAVLGPRMNGSGQ